MNKTDKRPCPHGVYNLERQRRQTLNEEVFERRASEENIGGTGVDT